MKAIAEKVTRRGRKIPTALLQASKITVRKAIVHLKHLLNAHPELKSRLLLLLDPFPALKNRLKNVSPVYTNIYMTLNHIDGPDKLPTHAKKYYDILVDAIAKKRGEA
jgi:hypothetical protein